MSYERVKRYIDILLAVLGLVTLSPLFVLLIFLIKADSPGPAFFLQKRMGKNQVPFDIIKFRTMRLDAPREMPTRMLVNSGQYITRAGRFLRRTSLDEMPQLWNILVGDMSFVGPRPVILRETDLIAEREKYGANQVLPGLTGWAQVNGRDELPFREKALLDGVYVRNMSLRMDWQCVFMTVSCVLSGSGFSEGRTESHQRHSGHPRDVRGIEHLRSISE